MIVKKTYPKILLLIFSSSIIFIMLYFSLYYYNKKVENQVYDDSTAQYESQIDQLVVLNAKPFTVYINNDTNWDEFVAFIKKKDIAWYNTIIAKELPIYKADYMVVYDANKNFVTHTITKSIKEIDFIPKEAMTALNKKGLSKFYLVLPEGIAEVYGAGVHPSFDLMKDKTKASGYFFVVKLMNSNYINELEKLTKSKISFTAPGASLAADKHIIHTAMPLNDYNGKAIGTLVFERNFEVYFENTTTILYLIIFTFIISLLLNLIFTRLWVYYPLDLIRKVLETGSKKAITELKKTSGEFQYIGNLFEENNNQKKELIDAKIKAEEGDRLKSSFLANLSHEIRTPMNAINGFTDLLISSKLDEAERLEYLKVIDKSGKNLVSIIDDLIEMSKIDSNQIIPNYSSINLEACIRELHETVKITIPKSKNVAFHILESSHPLLQNIISDEIKLKQIIVNLVTNGIKYTETGMVSLGYDVNEVDKTIVFKIKDTGLGIDEKNQKYIFDRFKRVDSDLSIREGGLGLGLAISKAYIEILNGSINLESTVGKGSLFTFTIPLQYDEAKPLIVEPVTDKKELDGDTKVTILIAEDDNINFLLFQKVMSSRNYTIIRAVNGQEAVKLCLDNPNINLVLMDIKMPIMNGFQALEHIRSFRPELPIIAQTAYASPEDQDRIFEAGFTNYITKPINKEKLHELIHQVLNA